MDLVEGWSDKLKEDLAGFADRGTSPQVSSDGRTLEATWIIRGQQHSELFVLGEDNNLTCASGPCSGSNFAEFLCSSLLGDFDQLAASTASLTPTQSKFVASDAVIEGPGFQQTAEVNATPENVSDYIENQKSASEGRTELYFLKGAPGAGKTTLLKQLTSMQARRYGSGESDFLFFYVSAQGRELSNLMDAFAGELQDLRANFTRDAVPALTRTGRLVPIIDGFDELLGTTGYGGAFSSLQTLLSRLDSLGSVVVSARSSFYDHEFINRPAGSATSPDIRITTIDLAPWTDDQLAVYLDKATTDDLSSSLSGLEEVDRRLLKRPFFASEFPNFVKASAESVSRNSFYEHLMDAYITREADKIVDSNGDPILPVEGHEELFSQVASEMWDGESRTLALEDLRIIAEFVAEEYGLSGDATLQLEAKISSYAGLASGPSQEFGFEHEVYFDHFLARSFSRLISGVGLGNEPAGSLHSSLSRGVIPTSVVEAIAEQVRWDMELIDLVARCPMSARFDNRRRNQGAIVGAALRAVGEVNGTRFDGIRFIDCAVGPGTFREVSFENCEMIGSDLCGTRFERCSFAESSLHSIEIDNHSWFDVTGVTPGKNVGAVRHMSVGGEIYAPQEISEIFSRLGFKADGRDGSRMAFSASAKRCVMLLNYAARAYRRTNILFESDENLSKLFSDKSWPELRSLMLDAGVVSEEMRAVAGPKVKTYRLRVSPDELLRGQADPEGSAGPGGRLWRAIASL